MNARTIWTLMVKDWYLHRMAALLTVVGSLSAIILLAMPDRGWVNLGASMAMGTLIAITFHFPLASVLGERDQKTLTFLMSLPISTGEYVASKILANLCLFLLPWLTILVGGYVIAQRPEHMLADSGFVPVVFVGMVVGFSFILAFALITESGGWTIAIIIGTLFLFGNVFTQVLPKIPTASRFLDSIATRGYAFTVTLIVECLLIVLLLSAAFLIQSRKRDFL